MDDSIQIIKSVNPNLSKSEELGMSSADSLLSKNQDSLDNILDNSQQYEVMYLGKLRLAQKRALPSFIDETVDSWKEEAKENEKSKLNENDKLSDKTSIPIVSIESEMNNQMNAGDFKQDNSQNEALSNGYEDKNRKLSICNEEHLIINLENCKKICSTDLPLTDQTIHQNKNHLHLPSNHSLITNTQSLDESRRESILSDLKEVNKQHDDQITLNESTSENLNKIDHLLTDNLNELGEIKRSSSAKSSSVGHKSKLNANNYKCVQMAHV